MYENTSLDGVRPSYLRGIDSFCLTDIGHWLAAGWTWRLAPPISRPCFHFPHTTLESAAACRLSSGGWLARQEKVLGEFLSWAWQDLPTVP